MLISRITIGLIFLPRWAKKSVFLISDLTFCLVTTWLAFSLRFDSPAQLSHGLILATAVSMLIAVPVFISFHLYRAIFRYTGWFAALSLIKAISLYGIIYAILFLLIGIEGVPRSIGILQPLLLFVGVGLSRLGIKFLLNNFTVKGEASRQQGVALIYGAGSAGRQLASGLRQGLEIKPIGFIDDDCRLWGGVINGMPVYSPKEAPGLIEARGDITDVLLAMPSASRMRQKEILTTLSNLPIHVRILPGLSDLANGIVMVENIREVEIEDVLGRDPVEASVDLLPKNIVDKVVLVTGAGGSIGSELCRQILDQKPKILVLFELNEFSLYAIERELKLLHVELQIIPVLGSVLDGNKLSRLCRQLRVNTLFHAAAYKHVPMIEMNPAAGVWNNVFGTLRAVDAASRSGVETFVLISTDKAVRPTNVMGCSKRLAELVLQAKSMKQDPMGLRPTKLTMVRFGNVLGSSGSVIPIFREQIKNGGPVTVTHPEIIRYFMTIPEAAQLVIQASALGKGGDVMVLDMGEPIKIVDLAKRMIRLSGFSCKDSENPDGDIEIQFTGLRPGEKLYEELLIGDNTFPTVNTRIMRAAEYALSWSNLESILAELEVAVRMEDAGAIRGLLKKAVPEYSPQ